MKLPLPDKKKKGLLKPNDWNAVLGVSVQEDKIIRRIRMQEFVIWVKEHKGLWLGSGHRVIRLLGLLLGRSGS